MMDGYAPIAGRNELMGMIRALVAYQGLSQPVVDTAAKVGGTKVIFCLKMAWKLDGKQIRLK